MPRNEAAAAERCERLHDRRQGAAFVGGDGESESYKEEHDGPAW